jgi:glutamyl-Q tRNA(Asp) synthetase
LSPAYRGRFAPSPTGPLHFGSLVAALASFCDARHRAGEWLLRIEDVDVPRSRDDAEDAILRTLARYGFAWDGDVVRQSARAALYETALERLRAQGTAYPCACTRQEIAAAPVGAIGERVYPGTCRHGVPADRASRAQRSWRVRTDLPQGGPVSFVDDLQGPLLQDLRCDVGDFVVRRADGLYAYQLAVVVDDAAQEITHVVRGADLIASTPRQILLQRLLGFPQPAYLHVPVAIDGRGEKLSKQTEAPPLPDDDPLPSLAAAWSFLGQAPLPAVGTVDAFWRQAIPAWSRARLPPVPMLPAPRSVLAAPGPTV